MFNVLKPFSLRPLERGTIDAFAFYNQNSRKANYLAGILATDPLLFVGAESQARVTLAQMLNDAKSANQPTSAEQQVIQNLTASPFDAVFSETLTMNTLVAQIARITSVMELLARNIHPRTLETAIVEAAAVNVGFKLQALTTNDARLSMPTRLSAIFANDRFRHLVPTTLRSQIEVLSYAMGNETINESSRLMVVRPGSDLEGNAIERVALASSRLIELIIGDQTSPKTKGLAPRSVAAEQEARFSLLLALSKPSSVRDAIAAATASVDMADTEDKIGRQQVEAYRTAAGGTFVMMVVHMLPHLFEIKKYLDFIFSAPVARLADRMFPNPLEDETLKEFHAYLNGLSYLPLDQLSYGAGPVDRMDVQGNLRDCFSFESTYNLPVGRWVDLLDAGTINLLKTVWVHLQAGIIRPEVVTQVSSTLFSSVQADTSVPYKVNPVETSDITMVGSFHASEAIDSIGALTRKHLVAEETIYASTVNGTTMVYNVASAEVLAESGVLAGTTRTPAQLDVAQRSNDVLSAGVLRTRAVIARVQISSPDLLRLEIPMRGRLSYAAPMLRSGHSFSPDSKVLFPADQEDAVRTMGYFDKDAFKSENFSGRFFNSKGKWGLQTNSPIVVGEEVLKFLTHTMVVFLSDYDHTTFRFIDQHTHKELPQVAGAFFTVFQLPSSRTLSPLPELIYHLEVGKEIASVVPVDATEIIAADRVL